MIKKGFTLIEMLLYITILAMMVGVTAGFVMMMFSTRVKSVVVSEVENQGDQTMDMILSSIRLGTAINSPTIGTSGSSASFNVVNGASSPTLFDLTSGAIRIKEGAGAYTNITSSRVNVTSLNFQNLSQTGSPTPPGVVRVTFTLQHINSGGKNEYDYTETFIGTASLRW
jgi:prepilin-type N-terminal cleavage/methylation domain-containing protein